MSADTRDTIASAAIEWAVATADAHAYRRSIYRETGLPTKREYAAILAGVERADGLLRRLHDLALAASGHTATVARARQMALPLEGQAP
jgi:hypothetical protein